MNASVATSRPAAGVAPRKVEIVQGATASRNNRAVETKMAGGGASRRSSSGSGSVAGPSLVSKEEKKKIVIKQEVMHQLFYR